jgi:hypothetical protein
MPLNIDISKVKEFTILPKNGAFYLEMSYEVEKQNHVLDINQALSIDLGTADNLAACVDTLGNSLLIDARAMKAMNRNLGIDLSLLGRRCLTNAARIRVWVLPKSILSVESQSL